MQLASKQDLWKKGGSWTVVTVEMTAATGLHLSFLSSAYATVKVNWGDGTSDEYPDAPSAGSDFRYSHDYARYGKYKIVIRGIRNIGFRSLDGQAQYKYDAAVLSVIDYEGQLTGSRSGAFKRATNLVRFIAPNATWMGQRDFAYCTSLEEVEIGNCGIFYDGTFQYCSKLAKFTCGSTGQCWNDVWQGCSALAELRLGAVTQFADNDFADTPLLKDIWISNHTVAEILGAASENNIGGGYGATFPWGASEDCRFHGTDGIVLGDGTQLS